MSEIYWPTIQELDTASKEYAAALALVAWGNCQSGNTPPEYFGLFMVKAGDVLGFSATPENIMNWCVENK